MSRKATALTLKEGDYAYLKSLIKQRTIQAQVVIRAHILLDRSNGIPIRTIAGNYDISPATVQLCISKYIDGGTNSALFDDQRKGRPVEITDDAVPDLKCPISCNWTVTKIEYFLSFPGRLRRKESCFLAAEKEERVCR